VTKNTRIQHAKLCHSCTALLGYSYTVCHLIITSTLKNSALKTILIDIFLTIFINFILNFLIWIFHRINNSYILYKIRQTFLSSANLLGANCVLSRFAVSVYLYVPCYSVSQSVVCCPQVNYFICLFLWFCGPARAMAPSYHEVSRSHTTTRHSR
jgi:hypothetical protein